MGGWGDVVSPADTPEPPPTPGTGDVWWEVIDACDAFLPGYHDDAAWTAWRKAGGMLDTSTTPEPPGLRRDMRARRAFGLKKYGTPLQRNNGRDHYADAYQEAIDLIAYAWAARGPWWLRWGAVLFAWAIRRRLPPSSP